MTLLAFSQSDGGTRRTDNQHVGALFRRRAVVAGDASLSRYLVLIPDAAMWSLTVGQSVPGRGQPHEPSECLGMSLSVRRRGDRMSGRLSGQH